MSPEAHRSALPAGPSYVGKSHIPLPRSVPAPHPQSGNPFFFLSKVDTAPAFPRDTTPAQLPSAGWLETFHADRMLSCGHAYMHSLILSVNQSILSAHHSQALFEALECFSEQHPHSPGAHNLLPESDSKTQ